MKIKNFSFNNLFYNNRFVMAFSLVMAVVVWLIVAIQFSPQDERVVMDVPVKIIMSSNIETFDLQIFGIADFKVDVTVTGKRHMVSSNNLSADDFIVTANTNYVDSAGKYSLKLDVRKKTQDSDFEILKISNENIEVYFDSYKESEYTLIPETISSGNIIPKGYFKDSEILSAKTVTVSGPATEVNKISKVYARITVDTVLTATKTYKAEIIPLGEYGSVPRYLSINNGNVDIAVTVPIYKVAELPVTVSFKNSPAYFLENPLQFTCNPQIATFGVDETVLESMKQASIMTIDFSTIKSGKNVFSVKSKVIENIKVVDNTEEFKVTVDAGSLTEKKFSLTETNILLQNINKENTATLISKSIQNVVVVGDKTTIETLTPDNIFADIDFANTVLENGTIKIPAKIYVKDHDDCWIYGQYSVEVNITK